jgi:hypothetical protein
MADFISFIKPELLALVPVLFFIGKMVKDSSRVDSTLIPAMLGVIGIAMSALWILSTSHFETAQDISMAIFVSIVQGFLCAGAAVYGREMHKQELKRQKNKLLKAKTLEKK